MTQNNNWQTRAPRLWIPGAKVNEHGLTPMFDEIIQLVTPLCIKERDMTIVRMLKHLQDNVETLEDKIRKA
jgi:hypothetical protein